MTMAAQVLHSIKKPSLAERYFWIASKEHQTVANHLANAQTSALVVMSTSTPKPRVESSNLSAPATKMAEIVRFQPFFISFEAVRGLAKSSYRRAERQIVQSVTPFLNASVWYSIKRASGGAVRQTGIYGAESKAYHLALSSFSSVFPFLMIFRI